MDVVRNEFMNSWWSELHTTQAIYWLIAIGASFFQVLLILGSFLSGHEVDHGMDSPAAGHDAAGDGVKIFSLRALVAFAVGFGWTGALYMKADSSPWGVTLVAFLVGCVFAGTIYGIMRGMTRMSEDGTIDYANAVGQVGQVYVTVPASREGVGQIEILLQGRLITVQAITNAERALAPQTSVRVDAVENGLLLLVSPNH